MKPTAKNTATLDEPIAIRIENTIYTINGKWRFEQNDTPGTRADLNTLRLSFDNHVITDRMNLIHPDDLGTLNGVLASTPLQHQIEYRFKVITSNGEIHWLRGAGLLESKRSSDQPQRKEDQEVLQKIIDAPNVGIGVFKAMRDTSGEIKDFRFEFVNRRTLEAFKGNDPTGTMLTSYGPDGVEQLQFFKDVIITGKTNSYTKKSEAGIVDGWFLFSNAPIGDDRLVQIWEDVTEIKQGIPETSERIWASMERTKADAIVRINETRMRALKEAYQSVVNAANIADSLALLSKLVVTETSGDARTTFFMAHVDDATLHPVYGAGTMGKDYLDEIGNLPTVEAPPAYSLAVYTDKPVITPDVFEEPAWKPWTFIAEKYDYRSHWSFPIRTRENKAVGTFAMYFRTGRDATEQELALADLVTTTAAVIIQNHHDVLNRTKAESALRNSEEKLRELNARLQETDKAKTAFFNNVSHEFRTPLTLLIGPLEELIKAGKSKLHADDMLKLQFAHRNATRLQKLVTTLLDFARIEAGKLEAYYQPVDFSKTTTELAGNFRSAIEKAGLKYIVKAEQIAEPIYLNREMWEKIVFNLLSNAFKFTHKGKIEVIIREKKKNAELHIKDTGVGIAPKDIERIFDRFTRIEGTNARTNEGTGIGLALVRELVTANGGVIKVKSVLGEGSEFTVAIPKGKSHFAKHQIFENRERQVTQDLKDSFNEEILGWLPEDVKLARRNLKRYQKDGAFRILIVEDNADMRDYLTTVLSEDDHKIYAMEDGHKVVSFLEEGGQADLILADVMMPVLDGFEMIKKLKANPKFAGIPIILLTAKTSEDSKIEGLRIGAEAYLTKPFSAKELRAIVQSSLARANRGKAAE